MFSSIKSGLEGLEAGPLYGGGATCAMNSYELHSHFYFVTKKQTFENINFNKNTETSFSIKKKKEERKEAEFIFLFYFVHTRYSFQHSAVSIKVFLGLLDLA